MTDILKLQGRHRNMATADLEAEAAHYSRLYFETIRADEVGPDQQWLIAFLREERDYCQKELHRRWKARTLPVGFRPDWREVIETIREKVDLAELAALTVSLIGGRGPCLRCVCPFHEDTDPSLVIYPNATWWCFGCGKGGSAFDWVMERDEVDFMESIKILARMAGVSLDGVVNSQRQRFYRGPGLHITGEDNKTGEPGLGEVEHAYENDGLQTFLRRDNH